MSRAVQQNLGSSGVSPELNAVEVAVYVVPQKRGSSSPLPSASHQSRFEEPRLLATPPTEEM